MTDVSGVRSIAKALVSSLAAIAMPALLYAGPAVASPPSPTPVLDGHWIGAMTRDGKLWNVNLDVSSAIKDHTALVDLADYGIYALPFSFTGEASRVRLERKQPSGPAVVFDGTLERGTYSGRFSGLGVTADFTLKRTDEPPSVLTEEDLSFRNGAVTLAGTILVPPGAGPHPAIVCTHGAGPEGRERGSYHSNGYYFARLGFVTLIYDKRGVGQSSGDFQAASMDDLAGDALAGVRALLARPDVDRNKVGVTGVSQGGWIAPLAAVRSKDVGFILVISPSGINPMEQSLFDVTNRLAAAGFPDTAIDDAIRLRKRIYAVVRSGRPDARIAADLEKVHDKPWFAASGLPFPMPRGVSDGERAFLGFEPIPAWEKVRVPVLALWGQDDRSVPAAKSKELIERALACAKNKDATLRLFSTADHTLTVVRPPNADWDFPRTAEGSRRLMVDWLLARSMPR